MPEYKGLRRWGGFCATKKTTSWGDAGNTCCNKDIEYMYVWEQMSKRKISLISSDGFQAPTFLLVS